MDRFLLRYTLIFIIILIIEILAVPAQNLDWANKFGGIHPSSPSVTGLADNCYDLEVGKDQDVYVTGNFMNSTDFDPSSGSAILTAQPSSAPWDIYLAKYDSAGNYQWAIGMGDTSSNIEYGQAIALDDSDNVYVTGAFFTTTDFDPGVGTSQLISNGSADIFLAKYNSLGQLSWAKSIGGSNYDKVHDIALDDNGNIYIIGQFSGAMDFDPLSGSYMLTSAGGEDIFLARFDPNGNLYRAINLGDSMDQEAYAMEINSNGDIIITGTFEGTVDFDPVSWSTASHSSNGLGDIFVACYNDTLGYKWSKSMGGLGMDLGTSIAISSVDHIFISGSFHQTVDFDPDAGISNLTSLGNSDIFVGKFNFIGEYLNAYSVGGIGDDNAGGIRMGLNDNVYLSGTFSNTIDLDPGTGTNNVTCSGATDVFLAQHSSIGAHLWGFNLKGTNTVSAQSLQAGAWSSVYLGGSFNGIADFDPTADTVFHSSLTGDDFFIGKYVPCYISEIYDTICHGTIYKFHNGDSATASTVHTHYKNTTSGCDSVTITHLTALYDSSYQAVSICPGEEYTFPDGTVGSTDQIKYSVFTSANGCDSVISTNLKVNRPNSDFYFQGNVLYAVDLASVYQWLDCDDGMAPITGATGISFTPRKSGNYALVATKHGCVDTSDCLYVEVMPMGTKDLLISDEIQLYPNPTSDILIVDLLQGQDQIQWEILDITGSSILTGKEIDQNRFQIDMGNLNSGVYFIRLNLSDENSIHRVIKY